MKYSVYVILAGILWGVISIFINILSAAGFTSMQCVALRAFFTVLMLFFYILITDRSKFKVRLRDLPCFLGTGILSIVFFNFCYFRCIEIMGSSAVPALLMYTAPVFVMLLSAVFFREKITLRKVIAVIAVIIGLGIVTGAFTGGNVTAAAMLFGLGAGLGYSLYSIFGKFVVDKYDSVTITFYTFLVASFVSVPASGVVSSAAYLADFKIITVVLALALISTVLPFLFYTRGLSGMEAGKASILATVEPVTAAIVGAVFFHESFTISKIAGMLIILSAIVYLNIGDKKNAGISD